MRIGISTSVIQRGKTGIAQYVLALVRAFAAQGREHQFTLFVLEEDLPLFEFARPAMELVSVPETHRPPLKNIAWHHTELPRLARRHDLNVLHVPSYRRLLWAKPCSLVATIHDLAPFHVARKYDWKRMFYGRVVVRRLAWRQHEIIAISENTAKDIRRFFRLPQERITVVHNGLEHDRFYPGDREAARQAVAQQYGVRQPFFLYLARLEHPGKNHLRLIAAFEKFKKATKSSWQLIFGGSDWHGAEAIHHAIKASPCAADIKALGFVADEQLPLLYRAADVFVYPSLYEGFGLPPIEAMACGVPVICSTRGSLGEVVGDAAAIIDPEDVEGMARELVVLGTDAAARDRWRGAGLSRAKQFNWNKTALETIAVYERASRFSGK